MIITVKGVEILVEVNTPGEIASDNVTCTGGTFAASPTGGDNPSFDVIGTIADDCSEVTGTISIDGGDPIEYTATSSNCMFDDPN